MLFDREIRTKRGIIRFENFHFNFSIKNQMKVLEKEQFFSQKKNLSSISKKWSKQKKINLKTRLSNSQKTVEQMAIKRVLKI